MEGRSQYLKRSLLSMINENISHASCKYVQLKNKNRNKASGNLSFSIRGGTEVPYTVYLLHAGPKTSLK